MSKENRIDFGEGNRMDGVSVDVDQSDGKSTTMSPAKKGSIIVGIITVLSGIAGLVIKWSAVKTALGW